MRKFGVFVVLALAAAWLLMWAGAAMMSRTNMAAADHAWPLGLGTVSQVPQRYPTVAMNDAGLELTQLTAALPLEIAPRFAQGRVSPRRPIDRMRQITSDYVLSQTSKTDPSIDAPPPELAEYLAAHAGDLAAISALLRNEKIVWPQSLVAGLEGSIPNLLGHMSLARILHARALDRARAGDRGGWDDLHAAWRLTHALWRRPELISSLVGLSIARSTNAIARKMPLPAPDWFDEIRSFDYAKAVMTAQQAEAFAISTRVYNETTVDAPDGDGGSWYRRGRDAVMAPYVRMSTMDWLEAERRIAHDLARNRNCVLASHDPRQGLAWWNVPARSASTPNLDSLWPRVFRFRAELEATERALRMRGGDAPMTQSACSDGQWVYSADGFRFSKEFPKSRVPRGDMPVEFRLR